MIDFVLQPNVLTGLPAIVLGVLVMIAFRSYAFTPKGTAVAHLGAALFWLTGRSVGRSVWWDVFVGFDFGNSSNWIWNLLGMIACYHALRGFQLLLPPQERDDFNLFTVAFYPKRFWRRLRDRNDVG